MIYYSYDEFEKDIKEYALKIQKEFDPDCIVGIARGGLTLAHCLSVALKTRNCFSLNSIHYDENERLDTINIFNIPDLNGFERILLVDDIVDSGESMITIRQAISKRYSQSEIKIATIFFKEKALIKPDFAIHEAKDWIEFFWDVRI